ncbi:hypothetical protein HHL22_16105 [Hymenobacter sp. RP-2-7]|uniref:Uncharacterized protein n=1 Tax=Hymenobacter polaris TaxID=2682546 RepID=A0A7Y0FNA0_9BACT|nr:hypothetical protein [Hymenobacter polaris]NML66732.1 hypothetical protein [Hymenobacter polaris]
MSNIERYRGLQLSRVSSMILGQMFDNVSGDEVSLLSIVIEDFNINIKDLSSFLYFIYKIDGLFSQKGFNSYSKTKENQIHINRITTGSIIIEIENEIHKVGTENLIIIYFAIKTIYRTGGMLVDGLTKFYEIGTKREDYLEKRERRQMRKHIREAINEEIELSNLDKKNKEKLVDLLDDIYVKIAGI